MIGRLEPIQCMHAKGADRRLSSLQVLWADQDMPMTPGDEIELYSENNELYFQDPLYREQWYLVSWRLLFGLV